MCPPGHAVVFAGVYYFCRQPKTIEFRATLEKLLIVFIMIYATAFLLIYHDIWGFVMTAVVMQLLNGLPRERLFYLSMYAMVVWLELFGTSYGNWIWPDPAFGIVPFLPSANPPSGISLFYFGLDLGCIWVYKRRRPELRMRYWRRRGVEVKLKETPTFWSHTD